MKMSFRVKLKTIIHKSAMIKYSYNILFIQDFITWVK